MKTLYLTDLDGTLLDETGHVSDRSAAILNRLLDDGVQISFATARSIVSSTHVTRGVNWQLPAVVSNGVSLADPVARRALTHTAFTPQQLAPLIQTVRRCGYRPMVYACIDGAERCSWLQGQENDGLREYLNAPERENDDRLRPVQRFEQLWAGEVFCVVCMGRQEEFADTYAEWSAGGRYQCFLSKQLYSDIWWLEALPAQATKAAAARQLKTLLGCDRIVFFGDGENDASLFAAADEAYAPANAVPSIKAMATAVIGSNREDGVACWLAENAQPAEQ